MAEVRNIRPYEDKDVEWAASGGWRTASRLVPTGEKVEVESKRCARAPSTWTYRGGVREYAMKVSVELGQKLCNITRVEMPIGGRAKMKKMSGSRSWSEVGV